VTCEREFGEFAAEERRQLCAKRGTVELLRLIDSELTHRLALHELPLALIQRGQLEMTSLQRRYRLLDAEKRRHEALHVRSNCNQQF
jgi:hypothetical protein